jgi:hypothetical protein
MEKEGIVPPPFGILSPSVKASLGILKRDLAIMLMQYAPFDSPSGMQKTAKEVQLNY